jgi:hypothetical protein
MFHYGTKRSAKFHSKNPSRAFRPLRKTIASCRNVGNQLPSDATSHARRTESSDIPLHFPPRHITQQSDNAYFHHSASGWAAMAQSVHWLVYGLGVRETVVRVPARDSSLLQSVLGPTQPPVQWAPRFGMGGAIPSIPPYAFMARTGITSSASEWYNYPKSVITHKRFRSMRQKYISQTRNRRQS